MAHGRAGSALALALLLAGCAGRVVDHPAVERAADAGVQGAVTVLEHAPVPTLRRQPNGAAIVRALPELSDDWRWLRDVLRSGL